MLRWTQPLQNSQKTVCHQWMSGVLLSTSHQFLNLTDGRRSHVKHATTTHLSWFNLTSSDKLTKKKDIINMIMDVSNILSLEHNVEQEKSCSTMTTKIITTRTMVVAVTELTNHAINILGHTYGRTVHKTSTATITDQVEKWIWWKNRNGLNSKKPD